MPLHEQSELIKEPLKRNKATKDTNVFLKSKNQNELDLLVMQKMVGNQMTAMMIEDQEDQKQIRDLSAPVKERALKTGSIMKQYETGEPTTDKEEHVEKVGELTMPTGLVHVGCDQQEQELILVTEEKREDNREEPLHNSQKQVNKNKPEYKSEHSLTIQSQNWENGAVAIVDALHKSASRVINTTKKMLKREETGNLRQVLPFLDQDKETQEKQHWTIVNEQLKQIGKNQLEQDVQAARSGITNIIDNKNRIIDKKKSKQQEFSKKVDRGLNEARSKPIQLVKDDFLGLIVSIRRKKKQEDSELESEESQENEETIT